MRLINDEYILLEKNYKNNNMRVQFSLSQVPTENWTTLFNRIENDFLIYSIRSTTNIIVELNVVQYNNKEFLNLVKNNITKADNEIISNEKKREIYKKVLINGNVTVHEDLSFEGENSELEKYLIQTVNNRKFE